MPQPICELLVRLVGCLIAERRESAAAGHRRFSATRQEGWGAAIGICRFLRQPRADCRGIALYLYVEPRSLSNSLSYSTRYTHAMETCTEDKLRVRATLGRLVPQRSASVLSRISASRTHTYILSHPSVYQLRRGNAASPLGRDLQLDLIGPLFGPSWV